MMQTSFFKHSILVAAAMLCIAVYLQPAQAQPSLASFILNLTPPEELLLSFSTIIVQSCNPQALTLQNAASSPSSNFTIQSATCSYGESPFILDVAIDSLEWSQIQALSDFGTSPSNTYISLREGFTNDGANPSPAAILQVGMLTVNMNPPILQGGIADLNSRFLGLMFSKGVNATSVNIPGISITFTNVMTGLRQTYNLTGGLAVTGDMTNQVAVLLVANDFDVFQLVGSSPVDFFISLAAGTVLDHNGTPNLAQKNVTLFDFFADSTPPSIDSFSLDLNSGLVTLAFSELIASNPGDIDYSQIYITGESISSLGGSYSLMGSLLLSQNSDFDVVSVNVQLPTSTLRLITGDIDTCLSLDNCFIFWGNGSFRDLSNNSAIEPLMSILALQVVQDITPPSLVSFSIDLSSGFLNLTFSEPINRTSINVSFLTLTNSDGSQQQSVNGIVVNEGDQDAISGAAVTILLSVDTLNFAKLLQMPRLAVQSGAVLDAVGNGLLGIAVNDALVHSELIPDIIQPVLLEFTPNDPVMTRQLQFVFDEFVRSDTWDGSQLFLTFQTGAGDFTYSNFTTGTLSPAVSDRINYTFSDTDNTGLFSSQYMEAYTSGAILLSAGQGLIADVTGNLLLATRRLVYSTQPSDVTSPVLASFNMDLDAGTIQLTFSEPVHILSIAGQLQVVDSSDVGSVSQVYNISDNGTFIGSGAGPLPVWELNLSIRDLNAIKVNRQLATSRNSTFLIVLAGLAEDRSQNSIQSSVSGLQVANYIPDTTSPQILMYTLDLNAAMLTIQFSEPVLTNSASLDFSLFSLSSSLVSPAGINMTGSTIIGSANFDSSLTVLLSVGFLNSIKLDRTLCVTSGNCILHYTENSFQDTAQNFVVASLEGLQPNSLISDASSPRLLSFELNLNTGDVTLTFDEPMDIATLNLSGLTFVILGNPSINYRLQSFLMMPPQNFDTIILLRLTLSSLNQVKLLRFSSPGNLALAMDSSTASDTNLNPVVAIPNTSPLVPSAFVPDSTPPMLVHFIPGSPNQTDITFVFDEYVSGNQFRPDRFTLFLTTRQGTFEYTGFSGGSISSDLNTDSLVYTFSSTDFNSTVRDQYIEAVTSGSVLLQVGSDLVRDLNSNLLAPISTPLVFTTDTTRPELVSYTLDLNMGILDFTFSEPVVIPFIAGRASLQNSMSSPTSVLTLTQNGTLIPPDVASSMILVWLGDFDLNTIKVTSDLGSSISNSFLSLNETFAMDVSGNLLSDNSALVQAANFIPDTQRPSVVSFSVDINEGRVTLEFSESILISTLDPGRIYLTGTSVSQPIDGYSLSSSVFTSGNFTQSVIFALALASLNAIKSDPQVCTSMSDCFLLIENFAVSDTSGNSIIPLQSGLLVTTVISDMTPPELVSYTMDLNAGIATFMFTEPIQLQSFNPSSISANSGILSQQFSAASVRTETESFNTIFRLSLMPSLLNQLKVLAASGSLTLSISSTAATDFASLNILSIPPSNNFAPSSFVPDTTLPTIIQFIPSTGQASFTFVFDEFVDPDSVILTDLSFQLKNRNGRFNYTDLSGITVASGVSDRLTMTFQPSATQFTDSDFLNLYALSLAEGSICFRLSPGFVSDVSGNLYSGDLLVIYTNTSDTIRPELVSFVLSLNSSTLNMTFTEDVNVFEVSGNVRFQNSPTSPSAVYNLMNGTVMAQQGVPANIVVLVLGSTDLENLVSQSMLATSVNDTFLLLLNSFVVDFSGNLLNGLQEAIQASGVIQVVRGTAVLGFDLDLNSGTVVLRFDRDVNVSTFNSTRMIFTNVSRSSGSGRAVAQLSNVRPLVRPGSVVSTFRFLFDSASVKRQPICSNQSNCFANFMPGLINDTSGNTTSEATLQVSDFSPDLTPPALVSFPEFNLNRGSFTLLFDEPVSGASTDFTDIQYSDRETNPTATVTLREGFTSPDREQIDFFLSRQDLNAIKLISGLCTSRSNCWIRLPSFFIDDTGMNPFLHSNTQPDAQASFHQPNTFVNDETAPFLIYFTADIDSGNMSLFFSEVVIQSSFYPENITLLNSPSGTATLRLSSSSTFTRASTGDEIYLYLTQSDLNRIKSLDLFSNVSNAFLSLVSTTLRDSSGNVFQDVTQDSPLQVTTLAPDTTRPTMISFDLYNNDNGSFVVTFDEPVDVSTVSVAEMTLLSQPASDSSYVSYTLIGGLVNYLTSDQLSLLITLSVTDLRAIKLLTSLATSRDNTFISISAEAVRDRSGNPVEVIPLATPLQLSQNGYVSDISRAAITSFTFDLNSSTIIMTFSDVLDVGTLDVTQLTVQNSRSSSTESYTLTANSITTSPNNIQFTIHLSDEDFNVIQSNLNLATAPSNTFVSFTSSLIRDINGLEVLEVQSLSALRAAQFIPDMVSPSLISFSLDLNSETLAVTFSEPVLVSSVLLTALTVQSIEFSAPFSYTLTGGVLPTNFDTDLSLTVELTYADLNRIKSTTNLATSTSDTYLSIPEEFVTDTAGNQIEASTIQVDVYTRDSTSPRLVTFDLTLTNAGVVTLQFSEAIAYTNNVQMGVILQNAPFAPSIFKTLTVNDLIMTLPSLDAVNITLVPSTLLSLLNNPGIAASTSSLYISVSAINGFSDFAGNSIVAVPSNEAMQARYIYRDCPQERTYSNITLGTCDQCSDNCVSDCSGPQNFAGPGGCDACHVIATSVEGAQQSCLPQSSSCPPQYFDNTQNSNLLSVGTLICQSCASECESCTGPLNTNCQSCDNAFIMSSSNDGGITQCLSSCSSNQNCQNCHAQCIGCTGPSNQLCVACQENSTLLNNVRTCVPTCGSDEYLARVSDASTDHECRSCHAQCLGCTGSENTDCLQCREVNSTVNGNAVCLEICPEGTFESESRMCLSLCPIGRTYDSSSGSCQLSFTIEIVIIVCCIVGGIILLVVLFIILFAGYKCCASRGKFSVNKEIYYIGSKDKEEMIEKEPRYSTSGV